MIAIIAAVSENHIIGKEGRLPWHLPKDLARFKQLTYGHPVIMGRKTFESIGKPLPGRLNIVVTKNKHYFCRGCLTAHSIEEAIDIAQKTDDTIFIIGGGDIYRQALPLSDKIFITRIAQHIQGDVSFPDIDPRKWQLISTEFLQKDDKNAYDCSFLTYEKIRDSE